MAIPTKECSECERDLPLIQYSKDNVTKDKLCPRCRVCDNERNRLYRVKNVAKHLVGKIIVLKEKFCPGCKQKPSAKLFHVDLSTKDGLSVYCKRCLVQRQKIYRAKVQERVEEYVRQLNYADQEGYGEPGFVFGTIEGHLRFVFHGMNQRCNNPKAHDYPQYGGGGTKNLFESLEEFISYVTDVLQVDPRDKRVHRIDNDGHYEKGNLEFKSLPEKVLVRGRVVWKQQRK
ncbi:hypothetical protein LCGC14_0536260 [marine sediment metagenome]|uniref:Uncharacterized protein n=1 Tax=marine sediment metagenome TaxID=412755 RepID=A0A0F9RYT4_9ZZZZ